MSNNIRLWAETYRPKRIEDCILRSSTKKNLQQMIEQKYIQNTLFSGPAGTGKTTAAKAMCRELGLDWIVINASEERGIDMIRERVMEFAQTASLTGEGKCVILDEADHLTGTAQAAFRASLEQYEGHCSFIFTCNYPNNIIDPLLSRLAYVDFGIYEAEKDQMQADVFGRVCNILNTEEVKYDEAVVANAVFGMFPDIRSILVTLQSYARSSDNTIDEGLLIDIEGASYKGLATALKSKKINSVLQWCADNATKDTTNLYVELYRNLKEFVKRESIPDAILIIAETQKHDSIVPSKEVLLAGMAVEMMTTLEFI